VLEIDGKPTLAFEARSLAEALTRFAVILI
jgi:hypothetical protein